jgi:hypothetical protein
MGILDAWSQPSYGGLLDGFDPRQEMMLSVAGQLLDNSAPSTTRRSLMQGVPQALMNGRNAAMQRYVQEMQLRDAAEARAAREKQTAARTKFGAMMQPTYGREGENDQWGLLAPNVTEEGLLGAFTDAYPDAAAQGYGDLMFPKEHVLGEGDVLARGGQITARGPAKADAETWMAPTETVGPDGKPALVQFSNRGNTRPAPAGYAPKAPNNEPPEVIQLSQRLADPNTPAEEKRAIQGRIDALTKGSLSPIEQKELFEATDRYQAGDFAMGALRDALDYNANAYDGAEADLQLWINRNAGWNDKGVQATTMFRSIMTGQALEALRATFGANPTEGERKILLEVQSSLNMSRGERKALIERAIAIAEQRKAKEANRVQNIQTGAYRAGGDALPTAGWSVTKVAP